jgi:hypothetical protein
MINIVCWERSIVSFVKDLCSEENLFHHESTITFIHTFWKKKNQPLFNHQSILTEGHLFRETPSSSVYLYTTITVIFLFSTRVFFLLLIQERHKFREDCSKIRLKISFYFNTTRSLISRDRQRVKSQVLVPEKGKFY